MHSDFVSYEAVGSHLPVNQNTGMPGIAALVYYSKCADTLNKKNWLVTLHYSVSYRDPIKCVVVDDCDNVAAAKKL